MIETPEAMTAIDRMTRVQPSEALSFAAGASVVRECVLRYGDAVLITPERGAMPVFWSAEGDWEVEDVIARSGHESPPIGSYDYIREDGTQAPGTLNPEQKRRLVNDMFDRHEEGLSYVVLDEVQKGGTMSELVPIIRRRGKDLTVIAAQDSRPKIAGEHKKPFYVQLASNSVTGVSASVVPMPLIATDRASLLNQLWYVGDTKKALEDAPEIFVKENDDAQIVFRQLGTLARNADFAHSDIFLNVITGLQRNRVEAARVEEWGEQVVLLARQHANIGH